MISDLTLSDLAVLLSTLGVIIIFFVRLGPRVDNLEKWRDEQERHKVEHEKWAAEQVQSHIEYEKAMIRLAENMESMQDWLKVTDERLIKHLSSTQWDCKTERRKN